jgi:hypothetical protein
MASSLPLLLPALLMLSCCCCVVRNCGGTLSLFAPLIFGHGELTLLSTMFVQRFSAVLAGFALMVLLLQRDVLLWIG